MANPTGGSAMGTTNKRKRGLGDQDGAPAKVQNTNTNGDIDANTYGLMLQGDGVLSDENSRNAQTAQAALAAPGMNTGYPDPGAHGDTSLDFPGFDESGPSMGSMGATLGGAAGNSNSNNNNQSGKPTVGSSEWHQLRKDNHKEVERRRREVINEGIENIAKIVPATEKNKGAILQRTYEYIQELLNEKNKFQDERSTFDIALQELTKRLDRMKETARNAWAETNKWQSRCRDAGLQFDDYDDGGLPGLDEDDVATNLG